MKRYRSAFSPIACRLSRGWLPDRHREKLCRICRIRMVIDHEQIFMILLYTAALQVALQRKWQHLDHDMLVQISFGYRKAAELVAHMLRLFSEQLHVLGLLRFVQG